MSENRSGAFLADGFAGLALKRKENEYEGVNPRVYVTVELLSLSAFF